MKSKVALILMITAVLLSCLFVGCGISQEEYDEVNAQLRDSQAQVAELQEEYDRVKTKLAELQAKLVDSQAQLGIEQAKVEEIQGQLETYRAEIARLEGELEVCQAEIPAYKLPDERTVTDCVEPLNPLVRSKAVSVVTDAPSGIDTNSEAWKIWQINYWVSQNITYVSDPKGHEYFAYAHETLQSKGGDCDDFAILLASMYESVGLDATIANIDTDDDGESDHMTCLVYWSEDSDSFIDEEKIILNKMRLSSPTGQIKIRFVDAATSSSVLRKYDSGIWIVADPPMAEIKSMVGYLSCEPYEIVKTIDVAN